MSIQLINEDHYGAIIGLFEETENEINIVSPFIGDKMAEVLCNCLKLKPNLKCSIITRFYREDFLNGVSNIFALKKIQMQKVKLYALRDLHTKLYLFDASSCLIGSANFTSGGFLFNHELSLLISDEYTVLSEFNSFYAKLIEKICLHPEGEITVELIEKEIPMLNKLIKERKDKNTKYTNSYKYGATIQESKAENFEESGDSIQKILEVAAPYQYSDEIWLKFEGDASNRFQTNEKYRPTLEVGIEHPVTCFPLNKQPVNMKNGEFIYIATLSYDKNGTAQPLIVARGKTKGFDIKNIATDKMIKNHDWMVDYPFFCELYDLEVLNTEVVNGIPLDTVLMGVGSNTYRSTLGRTLSIQELKTRHYQKAYIRLTHISKEFIDNRFDELKSKYGTLKF